MMYRLFCAIAWLRERLSEIDYANRRLLEIRTGYTFTPETERRIARAEVMRLRDLFQLEFEDQRPLSPTPLAPVGARRSDPDR